MKPQVPDRKYWIPDESLPEVLVDLWGSSNRPAIKSEFLFFREPKQTFAVPDLCPHPVRGSTRLEHRIFYLWQGDGSLAVYAYLFDGVYAAGRFYGCLYVGCISSRDWILGG